LVKFIFGSSEIGFVSHNLLFLIDSAFASAVAEAMADEQATADGQYELVKGRFEKRRPP
jgi:hypothetical protein